MSDKLFVEAYMNHCGLAMDTILNGTGDLPDNDDDPYDNSLEDAYQESVENEPIEEGQDDLDDQYELNDDGQLVAI